MATGISERYRVAVLAGGESAERDVSLESGRNVARALRGAGHRVRIIDPATRPLSEVVWQRYDVCLIALHGGAGEDGRVQAELARIGIPYTGSGPSACRLAMSKSASKERFRQRGVATPEYVLAHANDPLEQLTSKVEALGYPLVIKPDSQGSSLGVSIVRQREDLGAAVFVSQRFEPFIVAEPYIAGREFTVSVIDREALPAIEIVADRLFFDYRAKYESMTTRYRLAADLPAALCESVSTEAVRAAQALGTRGACRVDLRVDEQDRPWVLEVNAVPGMTSHSLSPMAAAGVGWSLADLCERMIQAALGAEVLQ